ncbi:uncharacterized protein LOC121376171 [Gigantopelta aegis]|uniref:uncharacterized protein LOC121376171 n=1 Tax=Gigantopelta aegis TaxID=1735272 RepID=UPI001B88A98D|nr:uncharacterized protein LOC121376171 [Gigantopelta aegis]
MQSSRDLHHHNTNRRLYPDLSPFYNNGERVEYGAGSADEYYPETLLRPDYPLYPDIPPLNITHDIRETEMTSSRNYTSGYSDDIANMDDICEPDYDNDDFMDDNINMRVPERKVLNDKLIGLTTEPRIPFSQRYELDFQEWMTWRKQVNTHLAAMILIRQGKNVYITPADQRRKCLSTSIMETVFDQARENPRTCKTSLPGKPYIMYGIPRVKLRYVNAR